MTQNLVPTDRSRGLSGAAPTSPAPWGGGGAPAYYMPPVPEEPEPKRHLAIDYYRTLVRHKLLIGSLAAAGVLLALLLQLRTQPMYQTRTSLDIQSLNGEFLNMHSVSPMGGGPETSTETNVQTQIKLLESDALMDRVRTRLILEPHPAGVQRNDLLSQMLRVMHVGGRTQIPFEDLLNETQKDLKIKPLGVTRLVEITCPSWDAAFSAQFCNTLTDEFESQDLENRGNEAKKTSDWLMHQAADVKLKAEDSQRRLFAATGGNGLILSQQTDTVGEDRLRQLQSELVKAQADRMQKEAQTAVARNAPAETAPVADDSAYTSSKVKLAELQAQLATMVPRLTEANPKVIQLRAEIQQVKDSMATQRGSSVQRLNNEYTAAKHREDLLALTYKSEEANVSSDLEKGSQVALLRREVESEQQLYQTLLQRAKEAGFASAMQASTIRVVDAAKSPKMPIFPRPDSAALTGGFAGLVLGTILSFFLDRNATVFRMPGESEDLLQLKELGVIPSPPSAGANALPGLVKAKAGLGSAKKQSPALKTAQWEEEFSLVAEAYRNSTLSILTSARDKTVPVYAISSPSASEGKSTVATNLGVALSKSKMRVVLVDGDLRKPTLHLALSVSNDMGLRDLLRGDIDIATEPLSHFTQTTDNAGLYVLPSGSGRDEPVSLLHSPRLQELIDRLSREFDVVLIDTPPVLHMADARIIASQTDGVILILRSGSTTHDLAIAARDLFDKDQTHIVGTLLNDFNAAKQGHGSYYKSYYAYQEDKPVGARS